MLKPERRTLYFVSASILFLSPDKPCMIRALVESGQYAYVHTCHVHSLRHTLCMVDASLESRHLDRLQKTFPCLVKTNDGLVGTYP